MRLPLKGPNIFFPQFFGLLYMVTIISCIINHFYFLGLLFYGGVFTGFVGFCFFFITYFYFFHRVLGVLCGVILETGVTI